RYSLLYTMALNRNWIDTTDLRVIQPAVTYYERHGSKDDKMKMYYYLGTVQHNAGNLEDAIANYVRSMEYSSESDNLIFRGLIASAVSDLYSQNHNYSAGLNYAKDALALFKQAGDSARIWATTGMLASLYGTMQDYEKSDSLYTEFFSSPCRDSSLYARMLMNKALGCLWKPSPEPELSVKLFRKSVDEFNGNPTARDYCAYAYAMDLLGNRVAADNIISQLEAQGCPLDEIDVWCYRISRHRGEYVKALNLLEESVRERDSIVLEAVNQSVALAQSGYYQSKSDLLDQDRRIRNQRQLIFVLLGVVILVCMLSIFLHKRKKWEQRMEDMLQINDNINHLLSQERNDNEDYRLRLDAMEKNQSRLVEREEAIKDLRSRYIKAYKSQLDKLSVLCSEYWESPNTNWNKDRIYERVKELAAELEYGSESKLEAMIDEGLDGVMTKLKVDFPRMTERDRRFIVFQILGLDAKTLSYVTGYSVATIYTKRNRLKERMLGLDSENRNLYLEILC
ncbi:MAG TPA: hypothetical protein DD383_06890, partial [Rikenellaceae bacterium]|nr:hypothetical protein [Rikenellaceae bacterium]